MARKQIIYTATAKDGRDSGKAYQITEMPAAKAEKWAARVMLSMSRNGVNIPDDIAQSGLAGLIAFGIRAICSMSFEDAEPLMDEMFKCVVAVPNPARPELTRGLIDDDIEEVNTRLILRKEIFKLHTEFFFSAGV